MITDNDKKILNQFIEHNDIKCPVVIDIKRSTIKMVRGIGVKDGFRRLMDFVQQNYSVHNSVWSAPRNNKQTVILAIKNRR